MSDEIYRQRRNTVQGASKPPKVCFLVLGEPDGGAGPLLAQIVGSDVVLQHSGATPVLR